LYLESERQEGRWAERRLKGFGDVKEVLEKMLQERYAPRDTNAYTYILTRPAWQRKTLWERGIFPCRCPQLEHSRVEGKLLGTTMRLAPYHFALYSNIRRKVPHPTSATDRESQPRESPRTLQVLHHDNRLGPRQPGGLPVQEVPAEVLHLAVRPRQGQGGLLALAVVGALLLAGELFGAALEEPEPLGQRLGGLYPGAVGKDGEGG
jgi:hypothetical protein